MGAQLSRFQWPDWIPDVVTKSDTRTVLVFTSALLLGYFIVGRMRSPRLPPGPFAFPVIGNMPQLAGITDPYKYMLKLRQRYGDIITLKMGGMALVVVFGHKLVRESMLYKGSSFANRPNWIYIIDKIFQQTGLLWSNGERWHNLRKFTVGTLRDLGVGKKSLEERIQEAAVILGDEISKHKGSKFNVKPLMSSAVANIICSIVFGESFEYEDEQFHRLLGYVDYLFKKAGVQVPENFFPWIRYIRGEAPAEKMVNNDRKIQDFVHKKVEEHRVDFDPDNIRDFIDLFLKTELEGGKVSLVDMFRVTVDLFLAGTETTTTSMQWFFLYMVCYPDVQRRCYEEINKVVGGGRAVSLADKDRLTYIMATLNEILRTCVIAPLAIPHSVAQPVEIGGYHLPKDTIVVFHLFSCLRDPEYWEQPDRFWPERWLNEQGGLMKHQPFIPFGIGPRTCIGEHLVQMELFLFSTNMLRRFEFRLPEGAPPPPLEGVQEGITNRPHPFHMMAVPRA